jgi:hypothetical protein
MLNGWIHGIVYTSDMSLNSCYTMQSTSKYSGSLTNNFITYLETSIFQPSSFTFVDDTESLTTVDII